MSRRVALPGAAELFRATGTGGQEGVAAVQLVGARREAGSAAALGGPGDGDASQGRERVRGRTRTGVRHTPRARARGDEDRRTSGRERHDEKITVYLSPDELVELEATRLLLRQDHGLAVDRGRIVREALAVVLADLDRRGEASSLVQRLRDA